MLKKVVLVLTTYQKEYDELRSCLPRGVELHLYSEFSNDLMNPRLLDCGDDGYGIMWWDDKQMELSRPGLEPLLLHLITVASHHSNWLLVISLQVCTRLRCVNNTVLDKHDHFRLSIRRAEC